MEDCNILNNNSSEDFFSEFCIEIEQNELKPRPKKQYIYTNEKKENKKKEVEKKQPKQRTEEELSKLFTEYPPSPFSCHTCNDTTQCKCNYKLSYDADDVEGYLQSLEKYGLAVIKDAISQEDCLQSANEFFNKGNQTADNEIEPINPSKPWSLESHIWTSSQKFIINIPPFTKQSFVNRFSPNIYKVFSNVFQQRELYCAIDDWGIFRPTKDLIYCKEKFLDVIKRKLKYNNEKHYGKFREDLPENKTPLPPPPLFDYLFYNIRFLECSEECANFPLIFYEKIENILKEFDQEFPSPPITFLDSNLHSSTYERADHLLSDLNDKNDENNKKCKGRCNLVVIDRKDWRTIRKLHFDLNPWKYLLDKEKGEKDLYQGVVAISDCPEEVGGFCCAPSSHLLLPRLLFLKFNDHFLN